MIPTTLKSFLLLCCMTTTAVNANLAKAELQGFGESEALLVGLGVITQSSPFEQATDAITSTPFPYIAYEWENAHLGVDGFNWNFYQSSAIQLSVLIDPRWSIADPDDSPLFVGIERDPSLEAGLEISVELGALYVSANGLVDISDVHNGGGGEIKLGFEFELGNMSIDLGIGGAYKNRALNQYLYGVDQNEASDTLNTYSLEDSVNGFFDLNISLPISERIGLIGFAEYEAFDEGVKSSPLIGESGEASLGIAILTSF